MRVTAELTLEDYTGFFENPQHQENLTINQLNQIISIHGFFKLHRRPKKELMNALGTINLLPPLRSTLYERISSFAPLTIEQLNQDLDAIEWQECPVQSVEILSKNQESIYNHHCSNGGDELLIDHFISKKPSGKIAKASGIHIEKPKSKKKRRNSQEEEDGSEINVAAITAAAPSSPCLTSSWLSLGFC